MLIDWVTARIPLECLDAWTLESVRQLGDRVCRYDPATGVVKYETTAWDSIRSDSHQISVRAGATDLWIQGSPARITGDGCAVFGSGPSSALNLPGCVDAMRRFVQLGMRSEHAIGCSFNLPPDLSLWKVSRVDVTGNLLLSSLDDVRAALKILRDCEGGRYRVSAQAGDTVYWSAKSKLRAGKAYAKGPHLQYLETRNIKKSLAGNHVYRKYTQEEIEAANRLLRLELKLGREFWARHDWKTFSRESLFNQWNDYFSRMIGDSEMNVETDLKARLLQVSPTDGQGKAAHGCWLLIQSEGWEVARNSFSARTWYRHLKLLRAAGLGDADLSAGRVVPLRRRVFESRLIHSWPELKAA